MKRSPKNNDYVAPIKVEETAPAPAPEPITKPAPEPVPEFKEYDIRVKATYLNNRKEPTMSAEVCNVFTAGQVFTIDREEQDASGNIWCHFKDHGWSMQSFLDKI